MRVGGVWGGAAIKQQRGKSLMGGGGGVWGLASMTKHRKKPRKTLMSGGFIGISWRGCLGRGSNN